MAPGIPASFRKRFRTRVMLPGALVLLATAALCGVGLIYAGRSVDALSMAAQNYEAERSILRQWDQLALGQEAIGLCEKCMLEAASRNPDRNWLAARIARPMADLFDAEETYILNAKDKPVFAAIEGRELPASAYGRLSPTLQRFVELARGKAKRPYGESNWNERLPGARMPRQSSVLTSPDAVHSTDLIRVGDKVGVVSVMQMRRGAAGGKASGDPPLLVNLRWFDKDYTDDLAHQNFLADPHFSNSPRLAKGEAMVQVRDSEGRPLTNLVWRPLLPAGDLIRSMFPIMLGAFAAIALLVALMSLKLRRAMRQEDEQLRELERAHVELQAKEAQAHHLAYHDVLTGLPNRAMFNDTADKALLRARHGEAMAVILLDLDRFKNVNDRFGHLAGDELIQQVARRLTRALESPAAVAIARLGGDEFAILLRTGELAGEIDETLEQILEELRRPYEILGNQAHVGVSIGIAVAPEYGTDRTELMRKADIALYRAKDEGRDCYRYFTESMDETVQLRATLEADLRAALGSDEGLSVNYQPLVDSEGRKITGLEALVRWDHPQRGSIPPHLFIPVAEETGLISALGEWVLRQACAVAREWPKLTVAINLSPVQFCDDGFAERLCGIVREARVSPRQIELEVTEGTVLDQNENVRGALRKLRDAGFCIALDDFGTGYSSLSYLREFEVDRIKIDKSFVQSLGHTLDAGAIVTAVVTLGHAMGLQVTAEGVETPDQEAFLRSAVCNLLQGFLFSEAVPASELRRSLERHRKRLAA